MCLIAVAYKAHPKIRLLVLANRDERHDRPTDACRWWGDENQVLSGRDLQAGGAWLAINRQGRFAAVTNYREVPAKASGRSRGQLALEFLASQRSALDFHHSRRVRFDKFSGFNLLAFDGETLAWTSNRGDRAQLLPAGVHALSNGPLNSNWPKVQKIRLALADLLTAEPAVKDCLQALNDRHQAADNALPDTGVGLELERLLSPGFLVSENYGTRCSTVLLINESGACQLTEVSFNRNGQQCARMDFEFELRLSDPAADPHIAAETLDLDPPGAVAGSKR